MSDIIINGPEGRIEAKYHHCEEKNAPAALVLHPHPKHGGTMNNKVSYNLYKKFAENGFSVLRFNFRGVGKSQGVFDDGVGELSDAATCLDWLQAQNQDAATFWVGGFSFGAWITMQLLMRRPEIEGFVAVSPPANMYDFSFLAPCPRSGAIVQGDQDSIVTEEAVAELSGKLNAQRGVNIDYRVVGGADHFFRDQIDDLNFHVNDYISTNIEAIKKRGMIRPDRRRRQLPKTS